MMQRRMAKLRFIRKELVPIILCVGSILYVFFTIAHILKSESYVKKPKQQRITGTMKKNIIVLISQPRSGSTLMGNFISNLEAMWYFYEPLQALMKLKDMSRNSNQHYRRTATTLLQQLFTCNFTKKMEFVYKKIYNGFYSQGKSNLCKDITVRNIHLCSEPRRNLFSYSCKQYKTLFIKLLEPRLPFPISTLLRMASLPNLHIIYLIRDPRASFWSLLIKGWVTKKFDADFKTYVEKRCKEMITNLKIIKALKNEGRKIIIIRYEDLIQNPIKIAKPLLKILGITAQDDMLYNSLKKVRSNLICNRNASSWPNWYRDSTDEFIHGIEVRCDAVMNITGYNKRKEIELKYGNSTECGLIEGKYHNDLSDDDNMN